MVLRPDFAAQVCTRESPNILDPFSVNQHHRQLRFLSQDHHHHHHHHHNTHQFHHQKHKGSETASVEAIPVAVVAVAPALVPAKPQEPEFAECPAETLLPPYTSLLSEMPQELEIPIPLADYVSQLTARQSSNWSFIQGLLLGQLSVILILGCFIKFFIFGEPEHSSRPHHTSRSKSKSRLPPHLRKKRSAVLRNPPPQTTATILSKTLYNVNSHQPESLDWFNVLIAQTLAQFREDARTDDAILTSLDKLLNGAQKPDFLDYIRVTEVSLGEDFPIFSNCRISPSEDEPGKLQAQMDVDLSDVITLGIETKLLLNWPKPLVAVLPVALAVSIVRFSGTLSISFVPSSPENPGQGSTTLAFSFLDDYRLEINVRSLVGSRSRLQDVPKIAQLVESRLHAWIDERCVEPKFQQIVLPSLWPRKRTTREQTRSEAEDEGDVRRRNMLNVPA
ncbi:ERMES complex subunit mmm1 [Rhizina undulata]